MKEEDAEKFKEAMSKEWDDQTGNFSIIHRSKVPEGEVILPAVWQMKRKRDISSRAITKYKARLNIDGSRMEHGKHYDQTYSPVASSNSIRTLLIMSALHTWHTTHLAHNTPGTQHKSTKYLPVPKLLWKMNSLCKSHEDFESKWKKSGSPNRKWTNVSSTEDRWGTFFTPMIPYSQVRTKAKNWPSIRVIHKTKLDITNEEDLQDYSKSQMEPSN